MSPKCAVLWSSQVMLMLWTWDHILRTDLPHPSLLACETKGWSLLPRMPSSNHSELCLVWANLIYDRAIAVWSTRLLLLRFRHLSPFIFGNLLLHVLMLSYLVHQVPDSWMVTLAYTLSQYKPLALSNLSLSFFFFSWKSLYLDTDTSNMALFSFTWFLLIYFWPFF